MHRKVKQHACMIVLRSAFPVRMSYKVNVLSEPILARTEDSARLNRIADMVSVEVGKVRSEIGALLQKELRRANNEPRSRLLTSFHPIFGRYLRRWQIRDLNDGDLLNCIVRESVS